MAVEEEVILSPTLVDGRKLWLEECSKSGDKVVLAPKRFKAKLMDAIEEQI